MHHSNVELKQNHDLTIINASLWDGLESDLRPDSYIEIRDGKFNRIGAMHDYKPNKQESVLDAEGRYVLPGLIDCHVHLIYSRFGHLSEIDSLPIEYHTLIAAENARTLLSYGYTTVRDVGTRGSIGPSVRDAIRRGIISGPRMVAAGQIICGTAGLADSTPPWMTNGASLGLPVNGEAEVRKAVRTQIKLGVDCIKVGLTGAEASVYTTTEQTSFSPEELQVLVDEANRFGKTVACHAQSYLSARMAVNAGVTTVEHGTRLDEETIELFRNAEDTYLVPTLCTLYSVLELSENPKQFNEMKTNEPLWIDSFTRAYKAGVKIAAGSDLGNRYLQGEQAKELELMVRHGMTIEEVLRATTSVAAAAIHLADEVGTVEEGKFADLIILNANPLDDIKVLQERTNFFRVIQAGCSFLPNDLAPEVAR